MFSSLPPSNPDHRPRDEPAGHDSGPVAIIRRHDEGRPGDLASAGHIFPLVGVRPVQLEPERAGRGAGTARQEPGPGDGQLLQ